MHPAAPSTTLGTCTARSALRTPRARVNQWPLRDRRNIGAHAPAFGWTLHPVHQNNHGQAANAPELAENSWPISDVPGAVFGAGARGLPRAGMWSGVFAGPEPGVFAGRSGTSASYEPLKVGKCGVTEHGHQAVVTMAGERDMVHLLA